MFKSGRRRPPVPQSFDSRAPQWEVRYLLAVDSEPISEFYATKQMARDRFANVRADTRVDFCELREPNGRLWFRDRSTERRP
jgi:hypothetical protein